MASWRPHHYRLDGHTPVPATPVETAELLADPDARRVALWRYYDPATRQEIAMVSTVFLVIDHGWEGPPVLFETLVGLAQGGPYNGAQWRYHTWAEAAAGHRKVVILVRALLGLSAEGDPR